MAKSDSNGNYSVEGLAQGNYTVMATLMKIPMEAVSFEDVPVPRDDYTIVMGKPGVLEISVTNEDTGEPVNQYIVRYMVTKPFKKRPIDMNMVDVADLNGTVTIRNVAYGQLQVSIMNDHREVLTEQDGIEFNADNSPLNLNFEVNSGITLTGHVYYSTDKTPAENISVTVMRKSPGMIFSQSGDLTDSTGAFSISNLQQGHADIHIFSSQENISIGDNLNITDPMDPLEIILDSYQPFYGRITCSDTGKPPENAVARIKGTRINSHTEDGLFQFDNIPEFNDGLMVYAFGYQSLTLNDINWPRHSTPETALDIEVERGLMVSGQVLDSNARPVSSGLIELKQDSHRDRAELESSGRFELTKAAPGPGVIIHKSSRDKNWASQYTELMMGVDIPEEGQDDLLMEYEKGVEVSGMVTVNNVPMAEVSVTLMPLGGTSLKDTIMYIRTETDAQGAYRLKGVIPGDYRLTSMTFAKELTVGRSDMTMPVEITN